MAGGSEPRPVWGALILQENWVRGAAIGLLGKIRGEEKTGKVVREIGGGEGGPFIVF